MTKSEEQKIKEEFGEYLRNNWDDRETLPVADWWIEKINKRDAELKKEIKKQLLSRMMKYDSKDGYSVIHDEVLEKVSNDVEDIINIIN